MTQKFKPGDVVIRIGSSYRGITKGDIRTVSSCDEQGVSFKDDFTKYAAAGFKLYEKLELTKDRWFIRTPNYQKSALIQEWLFSHGLEWRNGGTEINGDVWPLLTNGTGDRYLMSDMEGNIDKLLSEGVREITVDFKMVLDNIRIPERMTEHERKIIEIEKQISDLQSELTKLKVFCPND